MIAIIDYGAGNLQSVKKAFDFIGAESVITDNPEVINACDRVLLPGVGSFGDAMDSMAKRGIVETVKQNALSGKPFLGICLGLQLLFEESEESPGVKGLGIFKGKIKKLSPDMGLKIPHIGWNSLEIKQKDTLFKNVPENSYVYFVHSYYLHAEDENDIATITNYGIDFHSAVGKNNIFATQFHPEKSGDVGLQILKNFASMEVK
ncbi:MAG: imidazole glycerol phosphate synthase subunit HisH [Clostridia bacterium]|nr:imidazole glycerol phosphate synthase subunit HisH [Clostridia bacterium]